MPGIDWEARLRQQRAQQQEQQELWQARQLQQQRGAEQLTSLQAQEAAAQSLIRELEGQVCALATEQSQNATEQQKALELRIAELSAQQQQQEKQQI